MAGGQRVQHSRSQRRLRHGARDGHTTTGRGSCEVVEGACLDSPVLGSSGGEEGPGNARMSAADWLRAWDSQGLHRTGTDGDEAGAAWLASEAAAFGVDVISEAFSLDRIDPVTACLEIGGE